MTFRPGQVLTDARLNANEIIGKLVYMAARASSQSIANGTLTALSFDTPTVDTLGAYSGGTPTRFTPTLAGYYMVSGNFAFAASSGGTYRLGRLYKNGSAVLDIRYGMGSISASIQCCIVFPNFPFYMNGTTDYIEMWCQQDSGGALNVAAIVTGLAAYISITYVSA